MQITVKAIELNARTNGDIAHINGVEVEIENLQIKGSEKQIAWAQQIAKDAVRLAPWAAVIIKVDGGWRAYKFVTDAEIAKKQR